MDKSEKERCETLSKTLRTSHSRDASYINSLPNSAIAFPKIIQKECLRKLRFNKSLKIVHEMYKLGC